MFKERKGQDKGLLRNGKTNVILFGGFRSLLRLSGTLMVSSNFPRTFRMMVVAGGRSRGIMGLSGRGRLVS